MVWKNRKKKKELEWCIALLVFTQQFAVIAFYSDLLKVFPDNDLNLMLDFLGLQKQLIRKIKKRGFMYEAEARRIHDATHGCLNLYPEILKDKPTVLKFQKKATRLTKKIPIFSASHKTPIYVKRNKHYAGEAITRRDLKGCVHTFPHGTNRTQVKKIIESRRVENEKKKRPSQTISTPHKLLY